METSSSEKRKLQNGGTMKGNKEAEGMKKTGGEKRQTRVKVVIRVRPPLASASRVCVGTAGNKVEIFNHRNIKENLQYEFSSVYDKSSCQREIFEACVRPLLGHALNGENVSIFAYGPTGAGKTYTMLGTEEDPGMIPRVIHTLFHKLASSPPSSASSASSTTIPGAPPPASSCQSHKVSFSYLEIYNEKVQDLLNPSETDLPIREDGSHNIFVAGLTEKIITSFDDFKNLFGPASNNRTVAATKLNDRSSRSHCIVQLKVVTRRSGQVYRGKVYLVDLAGSEDNRRTGNSGLRLKESGAINKSLFVLGEVVDAINNNLPRIPYRNSKLTRLLQDSVGGSCHSVMVTNVAPEEAFYYDTYCTLNFATKSRKIVNTNTASVTLDRPAEPPNRSLKRTHSESQVNSSGSSGKRPKLSPGHRSSDPDTAAAGAATSTMAPLVPLVVQRQDKLERTVKGCMKKMEDLVHQLNLKTTSKDQHRHRKPSSATAKPDPSMAEIQRQLSEVQAQLREIQEQQQQQRSSSLQDGEREREQAAKAAHKSAAQQKPERRRSLRKALAPIPSIDAVLKDKTNTENSRPPAGKSRARGLVLLNQEPSCSPLFLKPPASQHFNKGFKSTACPSAAQGSSKLNNTPHKFKSEAANFSGQQKKQNEEFLHILNTAAVKRLQELHTVGVKRARLIYEWRQTHGQFSSLEELREIPGFTEKYLHSLLQRNFILTDA